MKTRKFEEHNYSAIWFNGKTIRIAIDSSKPIGELDYPEFYDIKITSKCNGGCKWCYMDSKENDFHFENIVEKVEGYFGAMTGNEKPFQVAIGGGEPTEHPDFIRLLKTFDSFSIIPNYTTNGMWVEWFDKKQLNLLKATKQYCGGVAVSCHPHLINYWKSASEKYIEHDIMLNFHVIISDKQSIDYFLDVYNQYKDRVAYFVLLPYGNQGRAEKKTIDWNYLVSVLPKNQSKLAFGANFYPYLKDTDIDVSLYEPEIMSKFIDMEGDGTIYKSSFDMKNVVKRGLFNI